MEILKPTSINTNNQEPKTYGVVNVEELGVDKKEIENNQKYKQDLKQWLIYSIFIVALLLLFGVLNKYFLYLSPLPPIIVYVVWKVKILAERIEKKNPL